MKKLALAVIAAASVLAGCAVIPSAYESGWTSNTNEESYKTCGSYRYQNHEFQPALDRVVNAGTLTAEQANRAMERDVRVGDPECLAYAAYGLDRKKISIWKNQKGQPTKKAVTYECKENEIPCPGVEIQFADGKVVSIRSL